MIHLGVAAGWVKRPADLEPLLQLDPSILTSVTLGSYTVEPRDGNDGDTFGPPLNALGLPNPGIHSALDFLPGVCRILAVRGMRARVSIAGFSPEDFDLMTGMLSGVPKMDCLELNFGCPNVRSNGERKRILAFDPDGIAEVIGRLYFVAQKRELPPFDLKLSPYSDPHLLERVAATVSGSRSTGFGVRNVVVCNTFPDAYGFNSDGRPLLSANGGYGGLSGSAMRFISLGNARRFRELLPKHIGVIVCGGIDSGTALRDAELAGACEAQVGLAYFESNDPGVFPRIMQERAELE